MAIAKADILTFVNGQLKRNETDIDVQIQSILNDLSDENLLVNTDEDQSLSSGSIYLTYPTGFKELISITLNDGTYWGEPLIALPGGHKEYRELVEESVSSNYDEPEHYSEFDKKFWLWPIAGGDYDARIEFYRYHPQDVSNILFGDEFKNAINFGAAYRVALKRRMPEQKNNWEIEYEKEKAKRIVNAPSQPYICRG